MTINYLESFPLPKEALPPKLCELLKPVGLTEDLRVEVASMYEHDKYGPKAEHLRLQMAVVSEGEGVPLKILNEAGNGVTSYSIPFDEKAVLEGFIPSISGYDYIVASWGDGSFYTFALAEKVWMTLGLTPRCLGNDIQTIVYDAPREPEFEVVGGEVSSEYHDDLKRNVSWKMSNEYLRRYLWLRGARGVRVFFYQAQLEDSIQLQQVMDGQPHVVLKPDEGTQWYELDLREHNGGILFQVWASVEAVTSERCPEENAGELAWPGDDEPMTHDRANGMLRHFDVYLDDKFLEKYEQSAFYDTVPGNYDGQWLCSPSYKGQWSFTECQRVGRNLVRVPVRELYKPKPDREIVHAFCFAVEPAVVEQTDLEEEHVAAKVDRLLEALLRYGEGLSALGDSIGVDFSPEDLVGFNRAEVNANGWLHYPALSRLAQVAPLDMTQQQFLARCKSLHELLQKVPNGFLKSLLRHAGCPQKGIKALGSLRLTQCLLNVLQPLNDQHEALDAFKSDIEPENWQDRNPKLAPLFINNDLRIADAHDAVKKCIQALQDLGFDIASLSIGYGRALDFVMDGVIEAISDLADQLELLVERQ